MGDKLREALEDIKMTLENKWDEHGMEGDAYYELKESVEEMELILSSPEHETVDQLRNQFECEYQKHDLSRLENGLYNLVDINLLWDTWVRCARKNNIISGNQ